MAASDGDSAQCEDMEQSKDMTQLEDTSEITHMYIYMFIYIRYIILLYIYGKIIIFHSPELGPFGDDSPYEP